MKNTFFILFFILLVADLSAQENANGTAPTAAENGDALLLYRNEQEFGAVLHSSGWGLNYRRCKHVTGYRKRIFEAEIVGMRHPKEIKLQVPDIGTRGYFYGKLNVVTFLRGGYGFHKIITGKSDRRGVELRLLTIAGPSMAFAKPVFLNIWHQDPVNPPFGNITIEKYDPTNPFHTPNYIIGRAGYFRGVDQMRFYPGVFCKLGISFEHSNLDDEIKLLETGIIIDAFYKTVPIMATSENNQVYINVYLNIMFGKKWF